MRVKTNPLRYKPIPPMPDTVIAIITHLPNQDGYHAHRLGIVKRSLMSAVQNAPWCPVLVWDNGSCAELRAWLLDKFDPDYLVLSPNVGKSNAMKAIFGMFPDDTAIAIADDDIEYFPGWLDAQLEVLNRFPPAVVSGQPIRFGMDRNNEYTRAWADASAEVSVGRLIPDEWEIDYARNIGAPNPDGWPSRFKEDIRISYNGMLVYANAQHCQFVAKAGNVLPLLQRESVGSADEFQLDKTIDGAKILRLTTVERYTRHMGNVMDGAVSATPLPEFEVADW